jgi:sulfite exporter TauE/SafE
MQTVVEWGQRRRAIIASAGIFLVWYGLELAVFNGVGEYAARW